MKMLAPKAGRRATKAQLLALLKRLLRQAGFDPTKATLRMPAELDRIHANNRRRYAQMSPATMVFEFAHATLDLDDRHRLGLVAHEVGHLIAIVRWGDRSEEAADRAAKSVLGITIGYDRSWPGKGLQYALRVRSRR